jgi:hypothetical protein
MLQKDWIRLDGQAVLIQAQKRDVPSTWHVLRTSRKKLRFMLLSFCTIIGLVMGFLAIYLFVNFDHHPPVPSNDFHAVMVIILLVLLGTLVLSGIIWMSMKNVMLVLLPDGFVRGDSNRPKKILSIHYREVAAMDVAGSIITVALKKGMVREQQIDCRFFERPTEEIVLLLFTAYEDCKGKYASKKK